MEHRLHHSVVISVVAIVPAHLITGLHKTISERFTEMHINSVKQGTDGIQMQPNRAKNHLPAACLN